VIVCSLVAAVLIYPVYAQSQQDNSVLPFVCDAKKGVYKEMQTMVLIPLDQVLERENGELPVDLVKKMFYEFAYIRGNNTSPLNAVMIDGTIYNLSCDFVDYTTNVVSGGDSGKYIIGVYGKPDVQQLQKVINTYKMSTLMQAALIMTEDNKTTSIALANEEKCTSLCAGLLPNNEGVARRDYRLTVTEPSYAKSIRQKEQLSFSFIIKNDGEFPVYSSGSAVLTLQTTKRDISPLYHASWLSPSVVSKITETLMPGGETTIAVTLAGPLLPGKYAETLQLKVGSIPYGKPFSVSFTVENDNLKLGRITTRDDTPYANFRATPSLQGTIVGKLDVGTYVIIKGYQDAWVKIETKEGRTGWVYKPFIREL
jgi:hypothetical protein